MYVKRSLLIRLSDVDNIVKSGAGCKSIETGEDAIFTKLEQEYCGERLRCLGARYVSKKCVIDYLANEKGVPGSRYCDLEVINNDLGKPLLRLDRGVHERVNNLNIKDVLISISHSKNLIAGMVLFCY